MHPDASRGWRFSTRRARPDTTEATSRRIALIRKAEHGEFAQIHSALWPMLVAPARQSDAELEGIVRAMAEEPARTLHTPGTRHHRAHGFAFVSCPRLQCRRLFSSEGRIASRRRSSPAK